MTETEKEKEIELNLKMIKELMSDKIYNDPDSEIKRQCKQERQDIRDGKRGMFGI